MNKICKVNTINGYDRLHLPCVIKVHVITVRIFGGMDGNTHQALST